MVTLDIFKFSSFFKDEETGLDGLSDLSWDVLIVAVAELLS